MMVSEPTERFVTARDVVVALVVVLLVSDSPEKVGDAEVLMFWMVFTTPEEAEKLVELKAAAPLVEPSAAAFWIERTFDEMDSGVEAEVMRLVKAVWKSVVEAVSGML